MIRSVEVAGLIRGPEIRVDADLVGQMTPMTKVRRLSAIFA